MTFYSSVEGQMLHVNQCMISDRNGQPFFEIGDRYLLILAWPKIIRSTMRANQTASFGYKVACMQTRRPPLAYGPRPCH